MADENNSDLKKIAELDFGTQKAEKQLDKINEQLSKLSTNAKSQFKDIGDVINNATLSDKQASKSLEKRVNEELKTQQQRIRNENRTNESMRLADYKGNIARENENNRHLNKMEERQQQYLKNTKTIGDQIQNYAKTFVIYQGFNVLQKAAKEVTDEMVDVEQSMVSIERVMNDSSLDIDNYRDKLIQLAQDYGNSFDNVSDITLRLAQAGFNADESLALTEKTLLALNTADLNATQATADMVAVMAQWNLMTGNAAEKAENYGDIIDKVNKVADNFPTTSADIMDALKKVSSGFNLAGASIDETIATITAAEVASQRGGKAIGTALANITQQLKESKKIGIAESLGLDFYTDSTKTQFKDVISIFQEMSEKMQKLKKEGKENSVEMQNLLSIFTVFRRNIGASLLGEMSGEDSTYMKALETSMNSYGYSLQENEKYMKTAKAAQQQFNAELLKLKTEVWDSGLEDVFREIISGGTNLVDLIRNLVKNIGLLPTSIGAVTLAVTLLKKETQATTWMNGLGSIRQINNLLKENNGVIVEGTESYKDLRKILINSDSAFSKYANTLKTVEKIQDGTQQTVLKTKASIGGYVGSLVTATAKTVLMTAATVALQAAISVGITLAITALVAAFNNAIHAQEKYIEKQKEIQNNAEDSASKYKTEADSIKNLRTQYEELIKIPADKRTNEDNQKILELQYKINDAIKDTKKQVELVTTSTDEHGNKVLKVNENYQDQLKILKQIEDQKKKGQLSDLKEAANAAMNQRVGTTKKFGTDFWGMFGVDLSNAGIDLKNFQEDYLKAVQQNKTILDEQKDYYRNEAKNDITGSLSKLDFESQLKYLTEWNAKLQEAKDNGQDVGKAYDWVSEQLKSLKTQQDNASDAIEKYNELASEFYNSQTTATNFGENLDAVSKSYPKANEATKELIDNLKNINNNFLDGKTNVIDYFNQIQDAINNIDFSKIDKNSEEFQATFAQIAETTGEAIQNIRNSYESGSSDWTEYSSQTAEAAENMLSLYAKLNDLQKITLEDDSEAWINSEGKIDDYATSLQNSISYLQDMNDVLSLLHDNMSTLGEVANSVSSDGVFQAEEVDKWIQQNQNSFNTFANNFTDTLNQLRTTNSQAFSDIVNETANALGIQAGDMLDAEGNIKQGFLVNAQNFAAAMNATQNTAYQATTKMGDNLGRILENLGNAIENFKYNITGHLKDINFDTTNFNLGHLTIPLKLPKFHWELSGQSDSKSISSALKSLGGYVGDSISNFRYQMPSFIPAANNYRPKTIDTGNIDNPTSPRNPTSPSGSGGSRNYDNSDYKAKRAAEQAAREEEEAYKKRLETFKNFIKDKEKAESNWVSRLKDLGQLSNTDYLYITQQRIKRYQDYLNTVKNLTWLNAEDRAELEFEYSEKIKDLQVDYLKYLKEKLDDEVDALKKANEEKIDTIKKEAEARINALKKVESETDRIRDKEDYLAKKKSAQEEIEYWEQRTGREAAEKLLEARKNLEDIDKDWNEKVEDWNLDDQIEQIEQERDAQVKAIQDQQEADIAAMQAVYDERVKLFVETGQIIYDNAGIQSQALYNQYKSNFVDPIANDLWNLQNQLNSQARPTTNTQSYSQPQQQYETYTIKWGDTLTSIAKRFNTTISKIMQANPYVKNKNRIYAGKTLQIPKFHGGGEVKGNEEGYALLKPNEIILKPEWATGIKKLANMASKNETITQTTVNLKNGSLININADIKNKEDANYLTKKITTVLKDKFNIKK